MENDTEISGHKTLIDRCVKEVRNSIVPFENKFPKNTKLYKLMTTKPKEFETNN